MIRQAKELSILAPNVVVKIPAIEEGLKALPILKNEGIRTNFTLVFTTTEGILGALAGASFVSPFVGRLDDRGHVGMKVVKELSKVFRIQNVRAKILAASMRHPQHVIAAFKAGADIVTLPFYVLEKMLLNPMTEIDLGRFLDDFKRWPDSNSAL